MRKSDIGYTIRNHLRRIEDAQYQAQLDRFIERAELKLNSTEIPALDAKMEAIKLEISSLEAKVRDLTNQHRIISDNRGRIISREFGINASWYTTKIVIQEAARKIMESENIVKKQLSEDMKNHVTEAINLARTSHGLALFLEAIMAKYEIEDIGLKRYVDSLSIGA